MGKMIKKRGSALLLSLVSFGVLSEEPVLKTFEDVMFEADTSGRRLCHEIFTLGSHIGLSSGSYAIDVDGKGEKPAVINYCDAVTGKTELINMLGNGRVSPLFVGKNGLRDVVVLSKGMLLTSIIIEDEDEQLIIESGHSMRDNIAYIPLPIKTMEVEITSLRYGKVAIMQEIDDVFTAQGVASEMLGDHLIFSIKNSGDLYIAFEPQEGKIQFHAIWIK